MLERSQFLEKRLGPRNRNASKTLQVLTTALTAALRVGDATLDR